MLELNIPKGNVLRLLKDSHPTACPDKTWETQGIGDDIAGMRELM